MTLPALAAATLATLIVCVLAVSLMIAGLCLVLGSLRGHDLDRRRNG
jgi:Ca2+/H+ antiporter